MPPKRRREEDEESSSSSSSSDSDGTDVSSSDSEEEGPGEAPFPEPDEEEEELGIDPARAISIQAGDRWLVGEDHRDGEMAFVKKMQLPMAMAVVSKRNTGKSYFLKALLYELALDSRLDMAVAFTKTSRVNDTFSCLESRYVFNGYSEAVMKAFFDKMEERVMEIKRQAVENPAASRRAPHLMIILDDVVGETLPIGSEDKRRQATGRCSTLSEIYAMGRHFKTSIIVLTQTSTVVLNPTIRNNMDYLVMGVNNEDATEPLYKSTSGFSKLALFRDFVTSHATNHSLVMFDNLDAENSGVRWYLIRAPEEAANYEMRFESSETRERAKAMNKAEREKEQRKRALKAVEEREEEVRAAKRQALAAEGGGPVSAEFVEDRRAAAALFGPPDFRVPMP